MAGGMASPSLPPPNPPSPPPHPSITPDAFYRESFDYLVIGGGTAGLVVATRLSENPSLSVGVLEAGSAAFDEPLINIPGRFGEAIGSKYDWKFQTTPQAGLAGRRLQWPRGKVLGGTSALNFMTWNRGCREDYDAWKALGNDGWGWDDLLPFFKKSECFGDPSSSHQELHSVYFNPENHGKHGPIHSVYSEEYSAAHEHWHPTLNQLGVETNKNHFGGSNVGVWTSLTSVEPQSRARSYSATAYYQPVASRHNLTVLTEATVEEIIIEQVSGKWTATGARFTHGGREFFTKASREVILCAGSVQSPQLLELSGVGSPDILKRAGIEVKVANRLVGENLQEHIMTAAIYEISPNISTPDDLRLSPDLMTSAMQKYTQGASGLLTAIPSSICYLPLDVIMSLASLDRILSLIPSSPVLHGHDRQAILRHETLVKQFKSGSRLGQIEYNFDTSNYSPFFASESGKKYATMLQMLQYPFSVGSIHIPPSETTNGRVTVHDKPLIDPRYYEGEGGAVDFQVMVAAQAFGHKITTTAPLSSIIVKRVFPPLPSSLDGEEDLSDYVRSYTITDWHPVGTCSMGPKLTANRLEEGVEWGGVVDARLRVHGVQRLRVVDASIMPLHVSAHIQATVYAISEKGASMILEDLVN